MRTRRYRVNKHLAVGKDCEAFVVFGISNLICQINLRYPKMWLMFLAVLIATCYAKYYVIMR